MIDSIVKDFVAKILSIRKASYSRGLIKFHKNTGKDSESG